MWLCEIILNVLEEFEEICMKVMVKYFGDWYEMVDGFVVVLWNCLEVEMSCWSWFCIIGLIVLVSFVGFVIVYFVYSLSSDGLVCLYFDGCIWIVINVECILLVMVEVWIKLDFYWDENC